MLRSIILIAGLAMPGATQAQTAPSAVDIATYSGLHLAAHQGDVAEINRLLAAGADPDVRDRALRTPAHVAAFASHDDVVAALVKGGAYMNALENRVYDVLTIAAVADDPELVSLAMELGNDPTLVTRLSSFHTGGRLVPFLNDLGISYQSIVAGSAGAINQLCDVTWQDPSPVLNNTIQTLGRRNYRLRGEALSAEMLATPDTQFCPACLAADSNSDLPSGAARYGRLAWKFRPIRICSVHNIPLTSRRVSRWDNMLSELPVIVPEPTVELQLLADQAKKRAPSRLQDYISKRLEGAKQFPWLDSLSLDLATTVTEKLGAIVEFGPDPMPRDLSEADWCSAGDTGWAFCSRGERGVCDALSLMQQRALRSGTNGISKADVFGMTLPWLVSRRISKDLEPVRKVFRDHYLATMSGVPDDLVFGYPAGQLRFSTPTKIAKLEGVDPRTLRNVLVGKGLISAVAGQGANLDVQIPYKQVLAAAKELKRAVSAPKGIAMLNASRPIWKILIGKGYLAGIGAGGEHSTVRCKAVSQDHIHQLLLRIEDLAVGVDTAPAGFRSLAKCAETCKVPLEQIIPAFLDGRLKAAMRLSSVKGIKAVLLDTDEVTNLLGSLPRSG